MAIQQHDANRPNMAVTINGSTPARLEVASVAYPGGDSVLTSIDATPLQGGPLRVYLDEDGHVSTDLHRDHFWLLAEAILPERAFENAPTGAHDEDGQVVMQIVERPLDLNLIDVIVYPLPEVIE